MHKIYAIKKVCESYLTIKFKHKINHKVGNI
jgi:hypothetical protein